MLEYRKSLKKQKSVFKRIFISYILVFAVPLLIVGFITFFWTIGMLDKQNNNYYSNSITEIKKNLDEKFHVLNKLSLQLSNMISVKSFMNVIDQNALNPTQVKDFIIELNTYIAINSYISDIAIYFKNSDIFISTRGEDNLFTFFENTFSFDDMDARQWSEKLFDLNDAMFIPLKYVSTYGQSRRLLTYIQLLPPRNKYYKAAAMYFIEEGNLVNEIRKQNIFENIPVYIIEVIR